MSRSAPSGAGASATRREGADGLYDRRLGRLSARRAPADEVARVLELFDTRYWDFTAKHFHEKLVADHGFKRSYNWLRLSLQAHGRRRAAPIRGAHRRKRPRRALPGMMLHQDGSRHEWLPGRRRGPDRHHGRCDQRDLLGLLRRRRGHHVELPGGVRGDPGQGPVPARSTPTAPATTGTRPRPAARWTRTPRPRSAAPWRSSASSPDPGLLARGKGALRAHVRHLAEAPAPGTQARRHHRHGRRPTASSRSSVLPVSEGQACQHNARFATPVRLRPMKRIAEAVPLHRRARRHPLEPEHQRAPLHGQPRQLQEVRYEARAPSQIPAEPPTPPATSRPWSERPRIPRTAQLGRLPGGPGDVWRDTAQVGPDRSRSQTREAARRRFDATAGALWTSGQPRRARPLPHKVGSNRNRSGSTPAMAA